MVHEHCRFQNLNLASNDLVTAGKRTPLHPTDDELMAHTKAMALSSPTPPTRLFGWMDG